jgi:hypothetical protein
MRLCPPIVSEINLTTYRFEQYRIGSVFFFFWGGVFDINLVPVISV